RLVVIWPAPYRERDWLSSVAMITGCGPVICTVRWSRFAPSYAASRADDRRTDDRRQSAQHSTAQHSKMAPLGYGVAGLLPVNVQVRRARLAGTVIILKRTDCCPSGQVGTPVATALNHLL